LLAVLVWAGGAQAKREQTFAYPYARVWTSAVRMLRVDFNSPITEKDPDSGYFLFDFPESGKSYAGSVEVVKVSQGEAEVESARVVIQLPGLPGYVEQMLLDRLSRKLGQEYGQPLSPKPAKPEPPRKPKPGEGAPPQQPVKDESTSAPPELPRGRK
jgi:hypothetical protein